jgi:hypothetical protein
MVTLRCSLYKNPDIVLQTLRGAAARAIALVGANAIEMVDSNSNVNTPCFGVPPLFQRNSIFVASHSAPVHRSVGMVS